MNFAAPLAIMASHSVSTLQHRLTVQSGSFDLITLNHGPCYHVLVYRTGRCIIKVVLSIAAFSSSRAEHSNGERRHRQYQAFGARRFHTLAGDVNTFTVPLITNWPGQLWLAVLLPHRFQPVLYSEDLFYLSSASASYSSHSGRRYLTGFKRFARDTYQVQRIFKT